MVRCFEEKNMNKHGLNKKKKKDYIDKLKEFIYKDVEIK